MQPPRFGLCDRCANQRLVTTGRGSTFSMCLCHKTDPDWPKYPRMPVLQCPRFREAED
ncbi:MAG: hypothetical protein HZB46_00010 [Solirubrobacterales bacterium]|nr:hypothetical protein [Solirubrobacterales bacterium]